MSFGIHLPVLLCGVKIMIISISQNLFLKYHAFAQRAGVEPARLFIATILEIARLSNAQPMYFIVTDQGFKPRQRPSSVVRRTIQLC